MFKNEKFENNAASGLMLVNLCLISLFTLMYIDQYGITSCVADKVLAVFILFVLILGTRNFYIWLKTPKISAEIIGYTYSKKTKFTGHFKNLTSFRPIIRYQNHEGKTVEKTVVNLGCIIKEGSEIKMRLKDNQEIRAIFLIDFGIIFFAYVFFTAFISDSLKDLSGYYGCILFFISAFLYTRTYIRDIPKDSFWKYMNSCDPKPENHNAFSNTEYKNMTLKDVISQDEFLAYRYHSKQVLKENLINITFIATIFLFIFIGENILASYGH
ncbi:MAG: hypothetical protein ACTHPO_07070 [Alphaproteobacteria bacterium]